MKSYVLMFTVFYFFQTQVLSAQLSILSTETRISLIKTVASREDLTIKEKVEKLLLIDTYNAQEENEKTETFKELSPKIDDILLQTVKENYNTEIRSMEFLITTRAICALGKLRSKKAIPLIRQILKEYKHKNPENVHHLKNRAIDAIMEIDLENNKDIIEEVLNPKMNSDDMLRYHIAEFIIKYSSSTLSKDLLHKALKEETDDGVILKIDESLSNIDDNYANSKEREKFLEKKIKTAKHKVYKEKYKEKISKIKELEQKKKK